MSDAMKEIKLEKVVINIGAGEAGSKLNNSVALLEKITNKQASKRNAKARIVKWDIRPGLSIGAMVTLRNADAEKMLRDALDARDFTIKKRSISDNGNFSIGLDNYMHLPGVNYDPNIGTLGMDVCCKLSRAGERISRRKIQRKKVPKKQKITKEEALKFLEEKYKVKFE